MFFFFSNRIGCLGSILISANITGVLLLIFSRYSADARREAGGGLKDPSLG